MVPITSYCPAQPCSALAPSCVDLALAHSYRSRAQGCSGHVGKMIFSAGEDQVAIVAYVPKDKEPKVDVADWTKFVLESVGGTVMCSPGVPANSPCGGTMVQVIIRADPKEEHDPLKDLALGMEAANAYLRERGAFPEHVQ